ncbi:MAG TPA: M14 family zinc carboxypeptidase [Actinomycetota bacterium]|nr:M14 family zinc carboxypeptidase [Actinomycetota bacterium]
MRSGRARVLLAAVALLLATVPAILSPASAVAVPNPVATTEAEYQVYGRVFPDPHGCTNGAPGTSPWAKGNVCVAQFLHFDETIAGAEFLEQQFRRFVDVIRLDDVYENRNYMSAGLPKTVAIEDGDPKVFGRDRRPLYMFRITDRRSDVPRRDRLHFVYGLSIHGIERAGLEGGVRAMEDLVTWAACEDDAAASPACANEGVSPDSPRHILGETFEDDPATPRREDGPTAGETLRNSVIYFMLPNPDGWHRGEVAGGGVHYQRYNGNGVDLNRDWPTVGYTYRPYSPASEPEVEAFTEVLRDIRSTTSGDRFAGGIDLHGQLTANAFSYTLLGSGQRDYRRNFSTVDQSLRAWQDQTARLSWSPYIGQGRLFPVADQWGTVVDTIGYQITGGMGDWYESPIGLNAVGIDNEMSLSHLAPDTVYEPGLEQAHIDGNKGLIFSQLASMLTEEDSDFVYEPTGNIGYVFDPHRVEHPGSDRLPNPGFGPQSDIDAIVPCSGPLCDGGTFAMDGTRPTLEFEVLGPEDEVWNGGIHVQATFSNVQGVSAGSLEHIELQRFETDHGGNEEGEWDTVARSFIQGGQPDAYVQAGQIVTANDPTPGQWRVLVSGPTGGPVRLDIDFRRHEAEDDPGQAPISASNMEFFDELNKYIADPEKKLESVTVDEILADPSLLDRFDSLVLANDFMPGFQFSDDPEFTGEPQASIRHTFSPADAPAPQVTEATFEFEVEGLPADNDEMLVEGSWPVASDYDIFVEQKVGDEWVNHGCQCDFVNRGEQVLVGEPEPGTWRVRLVNFAGAPQPVDVLIEFLSVATTPAPPAQYTHEQFGQYTQALTAFAEGGGNLVLTDRSLLGLIGMGLVPEDAIGSSQPGGRGAVPRYQFNVPGRGNLCTPDSEDPLVRDVCLPGTAGGTARQAVEPTPLGYTPDATLDGSSRAKLTQFFVTRAAWEEGCGKDDAQTCTSGLFGGETGLGERHLGDGLVRITGSMFPDPNFAPGGPRDMRFGLASYSLTFSNWQVFLNLVDYQRGATEVVCTITGTDGADQLRGTPAADVICGGDGNDTILGAGGDDLLIGGPGNDSLNGGAGNDDVQGSEGDDTLRGAEGDDTLAGGPGFDTLDGGPGTDACDPGEGGGRSRNCE